MLSVKSISVAVTNKRLLHNISFTLERGESLCIVGESGSGKTTLLKSLLGLMPISQGEITLQHSNKNLHFDSTESFFGLPGVSWVMQNPISALNPLLPVHVSIGEGLHHAKLTKQEKHTRIVSTLQEVELSEQHLNRKPHQLSIGQAQRVCIARALVSKPEMIFFDESLSALDAVVQKQIAKVIDDIKITQSLSYLFVTHDLSFAQAYADNILLLKNGEVEAYQTVSDFFAHPASSYAKQLIEAAEILGDLAPRVDEKLK